MSTQTQLDKKVAALVKKLKKKTRRPAMLDENQADLYGMSNVTLVGIAQKLDEVSAALVILLEEHT